MTVLRYRLHWARTYLKKVDAIDNSERGVWTLTDIGRNMSDQEIAAVARRVRAVIRAGRKVAEEGDDEVTQVQDDAVAKLAWTDRLLEVIAAIEPAAFERLCQRILRESGFIRVEVSGRSGDGGIDGVGVLRVNLISFHVLFQCKRWKGAVGASVIRDFRGAMMGRADKGLVITTAAFTADARREATRDGASAIDLVDGEALCGLLKDLKLGVKIKLVEDVEVEPEFFSRI